MGYGVQSVGMRILTGQHRNHAGHFSRRHRVDAADQGMCMRCAEREAISLFWKTEIVAVTAAAGEEAQILLAAYRVPDACLHDVNSSRIKSEIFSRRCRYG